MLKVWVGELGGMGWGGGGSNPVKILTIDGHISEGGAGFPGLVGIIEEQAYTQQLFLPHTLHIFYYTVISFFSGGGLPFCSIRNL